MEVKEKKEKRVRESKKQYTVVINTVVGTKEPKVLKKGDIIALTDKQAVNYKKNNIIK